MEAAISRTVVAGKPVYTAIVRDITDRKRAEAKLHQAAEELTRSNNELQQFAYIVSHDLQEPLRTIAGFLGLLERKLGDGQDTEAREYMQYILDGGQRMQQMIADLLAYARVGAKDGKREPIALREPLDRALEMLRASIDQSAATIHVEDLPTVRADAAQWTQVFQNLIGNAIKFRSERPLEIRIGARRDGSDWLLWVKDNGIGMSPEYRERIFEVFQRLHSRKQYPGSGIGLAICKKVVQRHGGRIWVESEPEQGATFYFTIPATPAEPPAAS
jgi:light-regulated signal transduction histidine kinase (bacteriophytochrome)